MAERPMTPAVEDMLNEYVALVSSDEVKSDLELTHRVCGEVLCDIQHDDTIDVLVRMCADHAATCTRPSMDDLTDLPDAHRAALNHCIREAWTNLESGDAHSEADVAADIVERLARIYGVKTHYKE